MRLVDVVEERTRKLQIGGFKAVLLTKLYELCIVADIDHAERFIFGADSERDLTGPAFQVLDVQQATANGVEERRQCFFEHLGSRNPSHVQVTEPSGK